MMRGFAAVFALLAGCYAPKPQAGTPCTDDSQCPSPYTCSAATQTCGGAGPSSDVDASIKADAAIDTPGTFDAALAGCAPGCEPNDSASGAIDVTAGGTFDADVLNASDDLDGLGCAADGGHDLYYRVTLNAPEVYYFDTFGSDFDTVVRVYTKPCADVGAGQGAAACVDDSCSDWGSQVAISLPAGESCIVIDQGDVTDTDGTLELRVVRGGRNAQPLQMGVRTSSGDTCTATSITDPSELNCDGPGSGSKEVAYFFTTCPNQTLTLDADICPEPAWDPVLYVKRVSGTQLACNDDNCGFGPRLTSALIGGGTLYYLYVDGFDPTHCGPYSLDTNLR